MSSRAHCITLPTNCRGVAIRRMSRGDCISRGTSVGFTAGSSPIVSDLFEYLPSGGGVNYVGDFTFNPNGTLDFTAAPATVPEPSTWALFGVAGLLAVTFRRPFLRRLIA